MDKVNILQKTKQKSKILLVTLGDTLCNHLFTNSGKARIVEYTDNSTTPTIQPVDILQIMPFGDNRLIVEVIKHEDL